MKTTIGLTSNRTLNGVFGSRARDLFQVPQSLVAAAQLKGGLVTELLENEEADVVFDGPHDTERWDVRERRGEVEVLHRVYRPREPEEGEGTGPAEEGSGERYVILSVLSKGKAFPMHMSYTPKDGDVASVAVYTHERQEALLQLGRLGWMDVEEVVDEALEPDVADA